MTAFLLANWYWILIAIAALFLIGTLVVFWHSVKGVVRILLLPVFLLINILVWLFHLLFRRN